MKADDRPTDAITFMERAAKIAGAVLIAAALVLTYAMVGTWDHADALITEATDKEELPGIAGAAAAEFANPLPLSHPLACDVVIEGRCYTTTATRARLDAEASK